MRWTIISILAGVCLLNFLWWLWAFRMASGVRRARPWKWIVSIFAASQFCILCAVFFSRAVPGLRGMPAELLSFGYIWHLLVLPVTMTAVLVGITAWGIVRVAKRMRTAPCVVASPIDPEAAPDPGRVSRREFLRVAGIAAAPVITIGAASAGLAQLPHFRVRRMDIVSAGLPVELDGLTIAHVSDVHLGKYTNRETFGRIVEATNALDSDLVLLTGDLIDFSLADLPAAINGVKAMRARSGVVMCEGNHDLFQGRDAFEQQVKRAGVSLLINEEQTVNIRGVPVQLLGLRWNRPPAGAGFEEELEPLLPLRRKDAFQILLAHHPHAFDAAADAGIPLTLSGHTHGGQLMLSDEVGAGSLFFKYWSGQYHRKGASLVVSNGVGNWFPLRVNAPAEIVHLTLRSRLGEA